VVLDRPTAFRFTLDASGPLEPTLWGYAGAARYAFNQARRQYGQPLVKGPWSAFDQINSFTAWKLGKASDSPVNADGSRGLAWRNEVCQDVFECAVVDLGQALANWQDARSRGARSAGSGFPDARRASAPRRRSDCATEPT
jgi:putative transposase